MSFSPLDSRLFGPLFSHPTVAAFYSDEAYVQRLLEVEAALARAEAETGVIPNTAAIVITDAAASLTIDWNALTAATEKAGVPVGGVVGQLRHAAGQSGSYVHWGATTQDIMDTAATLQARAALLVVESELDVLIRSLAALAVDHRRTVLAGRTHSQQALPVTLGLKAAVWLAPLLRHKQRLEQIRPRLLTVQLGGAAGTLAALGDAGPAVVAAFAHQLGLGEPLLPWHTQRDTIAELAGWLSLVTGSLGKVAQDIILSAQTEVGELHETGDRERGGSSTMPQKHNPIISETIIAAARANASLLSAVHQAQIQENERGTHGWQLEWLTLPQMFGLTSGALYRANGIVSNLVVFPAVMAANLAASQGLLLAEAAVFALTPHLGRPEATRVVSAACRTAVDSGDHLIDILAQSEQADVDWHALRQDADYLGSTDLFIDRVLAAVTDLHSS